MLQVRENEISLRKWSAAYLRTLGGRLMPSYTWLGGAWRLTILVNHADVI